MYKSILCKTPRNYGDNKWFISSAPALGRPPLHRAEEGGGVNRKRAEEVVEAFRGMSDVIQGELLLGAPLAPARPWRGRGTVDGVQRVPKRQGSSGELTEVVNQKNSPKPES